MTEMTTKILRQFFTRDPVTVDRYALRYVCLAVLPSSSRFQSGSVLFITKAYLLLFLISFYDIFSAHCAKKGPVQRRVAGKDSIPPHQDKGAKLSLCKRNSFSQYVLCPKESTTIPTKVVEEQQ